MASGQPTSADVRREIRAGKLPPVWVWAGPEAYLKTELFTMLVDAAMDKSLVSLNVNRFRGGEKPAEEEEEDEREKLPVEAAEGSGDASGMDDEAKRERRIARRAAADRRFGQHRLIDQVIVAAKTLPMLAPRRIVLLAAGENLDRWSRDALVAYAEAPAAEATLVVNLGLPPKDTFVQRLGRAGARVAAFWVPFENDAKRWISLEFKKQGKTCSPRVAALLYAHCVGGEDKVPLSDIAPEIEKIASGMGPQETEVTETHLDSIARKASETFLRRLQDAAGDGDLHQALRALDGALLFKENAPVRIVATLMYRVDRISGSPRARAARRRGLLALAEADRKLKSTPQDPRLVLETALFTLCGVD